MAAKRGAQAAAADGVVDQAYELVQVDLLMPHPDNPRRGDVGVIQESVEANGFYGALIVQRSTGHILAGNHRWQAARAQGIETVPVIWVDVDDDRARRILAVDNRANDVAGYDEAALLSLLNQISADGGGLAGTGYSEDAMAELLKRTENPEPPEDFPSYDDDLPTQHRCPSCGYEWSGKSAS